MRLASLNNEADPNDCFGITSLSMTVMEYEILQNIPCYFLI